MKTMTLNLKNEEMQVLEDLSGAQDLSKTAVIRQALRLYQMVHRRMQDGETMHFSGDPERALQFIGPGFSSGPSK
jgi:predicted transcriptional regulator